MVTGRTALTRLASISFVALFGILAVGCGDDTPSQADGGTGGAGGSGGRGGDAGVDSRDADAGDTGDLPTDRTDTGEAGDVPTDRGDTGDAPVDRTETGDGPTDQGETGDAPTDTTEVARDCYMVTFDQPVNNSTLTAANDKDADQCLNGFQYDVKITSADAPDGTAVTLFGNNVQLTTATITGGKATFTGVQLASAGDTTLSIQFPGTKTCTLPSTQSKVTVSCIVPSCAISKPIRTTLNGVPTGQGGDRISPDGSPYQTAFEVTTNIEDGQPVALKINNAATPATIATVMGTAMSGKATFSGVTLSPDASYEVVATCTDRNNVVGSSAKSTFKVDTAPPDLTISSPASGAFLGPTDLTNGAFRVCGKTTATDAVALPPSVGVLANNFCITGTSNCAPVTAVGTDACVNLTCPGGAPFDISVNLNDGAGNTVTKTVTGVACASALPSVRIALPISDAPTFNDTTKHILSAAGSSPLKDLDGATAGAQANVTACSDRTGMAQLLVGHAGDATLSPLGSAVATVAAVANECPSGFGFAAHFNGVTLPESTESATGALTAATELQVRLTDISTATGSSTPVDIWVDTAAPVIALMSPGGLCGSFQQTATTFTTDVALTSDTGSVSLTVTNGSSTDTRNNPTFASGVATFTAVAFDQGQNALAAVATDPAGNSTTLAPVPCLVTVGGAPAVTFSTPLMTQKLCPNGSVVTGCIPDNDLGTTGWQGSITVHATVGAIPLGSTNVTFTIGATTLGTAMLDVNGDATLAITTNIVPEGANVTFTATTDNVPAHGVGVGTVTVNVDTLPPEAASVPVVGTMTDVQRRQTSFPLTWTAPLDHGRNVTSYQVRVAKVPITSSNFDDTAANVANPNFIVTQDVPYTSTPAAEGLPDGIVVPDLNIELGYYFAVAPIDSSGTRGPISATTTAATANFIPLVLTDPGAGFAIDSGDFGTGVGMTFAADNLSDLVVGSRGSNAIRIYFATGSGYSTASSTQITFPAPATGTQNLVVANVGDLDADTLDDLAVSSSTANTIWIFSRKSPSFGSSWPMTLTQAQAKYTLTIDSGSLFFGKLSQRPLARLGNYDTTDPDDLAIGFSGYVGPLGQKGAVLIIRGSSSFPAALTIPEAVPTNTIQIDGSITASNSFFGATTVGIGQFYSTPAGSTLLVGATGTGSVFAFAGPMTTASETVIDALHTDYSRTIGVIGSLGGSPNAVTVASTVAGRVDIHLGSIAMGGPLRTTAGMAPAARTTLIDTAAGNSFGAVNLGGGIRGTTGSVSFIGGDMTPDLIVGGLSEGVANAGPLYIVNGVAIPNLPASDVDVSLIGPTAMGTGVVPTIVKVSNQIPPPASSATMWGGYAGTCVVPDLNGDGAGDFAVSESAIAPATGRVIVFY